VFKLEKHVSQTLEVASIAGGLLFGQLGTKGVASNAGGLLFAQLGTKGLAQPQRIFCTVGNNLT